MRSAGRSSSGIARHSCARRVVEREVEPRGELHRAQHAQAVVGERRADRRCAAARRSRSRAAVERIEVLAGQRIPRDRVDREVAAPRRLFDRHVRIAGDDEAAVAAAGLRIAPRQRDVDVADLVDLKALADRFDAAEAIRAARAGDRPATPNTSRSTLSARGRRRAAADRAPSRRRSARGRRRRGRRRQSRAIETRSASNPARSAHRDRLRGRTACTNRSQNAGRERVEDRPARATSQCG